MSTAQKMAKAELFEVDADFKNVINTEKKCTVQFNPETLKVSFANQIATNSGTGDQKGPSTRQFVGAGTTKLSLQLWFDVTAIPPEEKQERDVRTLTTKVAYFITPKPEGENFLPPRVRFIWGSFQFDGIMESMEESLEFFSSDGRPLRASVSINLSQQKIMEFKGDENTGPNSTPSPGTRKMTPAPKGKSVQNLADMLGKGANWQVIASANGIENPRLLQPGQLIDLNAGVSGSFDVGSG